jgi:hypothetical protein
MALNSDLREFLQLLNTNVVEYIVVGGVAVGFHGYPRYTGDLDVWVRPTAENAKRVFKAISEFGFGNIGLQPEDFEQPHRTVQLGFPPFRLDILTGITGVENDDLWSSRVKAELEGIPVEVIGRDDLIRNKEATRRPQDIADADKLKKRAKR